MDTQYDLMIDIEGLGPTPTPVILSIGAVAFDPSKVESAETLRNRGFYVNINGLSCENVGMKMDSKTF